MCPGPGPGNLFFSLYAIFLVVLASAASPLISSAERHDYPTANLSTRWVNNAAALPHSVTFSDGSAVRPIVLRSPQNLEGPSFAAGFFCTPPCNSFFFGIFIVHTNSSGSITMLTTGNPQVVWSANDRGRAVKENATIELTSLGSLILLDMDGTFVWSSSSSGQSVVGMSITDIGNLVLFDGNNKTMWQSFAHPTDTLLPGQSLMQGMKLTASTTSATNGMENQLYLTVLADGLYGFVDSEPPQPYFMEQVRKNNTDRTWVALTNGSLDIYVQFTRSSNPDKSLPLPAAKSKQYMRLDSDGHLRLYEWSDAELKWIVVCNVIKPFPGECAFPTVCGKYGICKGGQCICPRKSNPNTVYFNPVDGTNANLGCVPLNPISCQGTQSHELLKFDNVSYFDLSHTIPSATTRYACQQSCLKECTCKAVMFRYGLNESEGQCMLIKEVFSLQAVQPETIEYNSTVYLKVWSASGRVPSASGRVTSASGPISASSPIPYEYGPISSEYGPMPSVSGSKEHRTKVILGATLAPVIILVLFVSVFTLYVWKRSKSGIGEEIELDILPRTPVRISFDELRKHTENFSKKLGEGGFGSVFEGIIGEERVAVKRLESARQGKKEFLAEVETIGSIEHINLVRLVGFCAEKANRLLVYEYMSGGSLDRWIYYHHNNGTLSWCTRFKIILDIAKGLRYLHEECRRKIAHLDIKPQNILLDENFNAKVADFGLCKLIDRDQSKVVTVMRGTPGYLAPEWLTSQITEKVDVYSYGVVLMEVISGRKCVDNSQPESSVHLISLLREKALSDQLIDMIDKHCDDMVSYKVEVIEIMKLAMWCLQNDSNQRPSMSTVVKVLEGAMSVGSSVYNGFLSSDPIQDNLSAYSSPHPASILSGPR